MKNTIWLLAKKIQGGKNNDEISFKPSIKVATFGIAIGIGIMILTLCIVIGFKQAITNKVAGFCAHLQVVNFESNNTHQLSPIWYTDSLLDALSNIPHVLRATPFITKEGIIKTDSLFQSIVVKGIESKNKNKGWTFFEQCLINGRLPLNNDEIIVSQLMLKRIKKEVGDFILAYFMDHSIRVRKYKIVGIYQTGLVDYDRFFVLSTLEGLQRLNRWEQYQVSGIEISVDNVKNLEVVDNNVYAIVANKEDIEGNVYFIQNLIKRNPEIFAWLNLLDTNVVVILILMCAVALFSVISGLVIILLEHIRTIGILKILGANNNFIKKIFILLGFRMVAKGLLIGNIIGLSLCVFQYTAHCVPLDADIYYVNYVPISFPWVGIIGINIAMTLVAFFTLLLPASIVSKIEPSFIIKFE